MSEQQESRPLTRRERRLLEMAAAEQGNEAQPSAADAQEPADSPKDDAEAQAVPAAQVGGHRGPADSLHGTESAAPDPSQDAGDSDASEPEIDISPVDADGNPRTRREMRRLREEALERLAAAAAAEASDAPDAVPAAEEPEAPVEEPEAPVEEPEAPAEPEEAVASDAVVASDEAAAPEDGDTPDDADVPEAADAPEEKSPSESPAAAEVPPPPVSAFDRARATPQATTTDAEPARSDDTGQQEEKAIDADDSAGGAADEHSDDRSAGAEGAGFDEIVAPTEPFSLEDLREAEGAPDGAVPTVSELVEEPSSAELPATEPLAETPAEVAEEKPKSRLPWRRGRSKSKNTAPEPEAPDEASDEITADADLSVAAVGDVSEPDDSQQSSAVTDGQEDAGVAEQVELAESARADEEAGVLSEIVEENAAADSSEAEAGSSSSEAEPEQPKQGYSFPDIVPPEEWRSVFDDPSTRVVPNAPRTEPAQSTGGFDDLISRAVVEEGGTDGSNTAALILPSMPQDGGLSGPLGGTGELFVTGSIDLPKSIGETGGHSSLHDSIEMDPVDEEPGSPQAPVPSESDGGPVSARRAVSAVSQTGVPTITEVKKDRSKLPLVLSVTGGTLVLGVGALVVWGATNGFFG
ncbi:hypothetical protein [Leucobacter sp. GX24907]